MDKVFIKGLEVEGIIGIFQWEREVTQVISVDIEMEFDNKLAAKSDSIEDALNYKKVGKRVTAFVQKSKFKLEDVIKLYNDSLIKGYVITDIDNDGMLQGLNLSFIKLYCQKFILWTIWHYLINISKLMLFN